MHQMLFTVLLKKKNCVNIKAFCCTRINPKPVIQYIKEINKNGQCIKYENRTRDYNNVLYRTVRRYCIICLNT